MLQAGSSSSGSSSPVFLQSSEATSSDSYRKHISVAFPSHGSANQLRLFADIPNCVKRDDVCPSKLLLEREQRLGGGDEETVSFIRGKRLLRELSTWGIGGPCNYFVEVFDEIQLISAIRFCATNSIEFLIIGKGSNCLFDDSGFDGCIILNRITTFENIEDGVYRVGGGYPINKLGVQCSNAGFGGLEFAGGVPGTVGGAAFMNAGADGQETADSIESVEIITTDGIKRVLQRKELAFGYRTSSFQEMKDLAAIVSVTFRLNRSATAKTKLQRHLERRRKSQPIYQRSAGSVFRNPEGLGVSAGELIEKTGLKGFVLGGAKISELHANFFINFNRSSSKNMIDLINLVGEKVDQQFGIRLRKEIRIVPYNAS
ncbi:hypothetical protein H6P81_008884 [Aristolochia fimbriata]|uniref:UDP-N-acetylmuramate dehydrogenase n=1 Tax=Aristolochia fimbriata TaxID=158543 RepID=A0AAV7EJM4_ARIFI|nr:hypothetical protein H6P81_008884 [Aristolochia fimbriata]